MFTVSDRGETIYRQYESYIQNDQQKWTSPEPSCHESGSKWYL